MLSGYSILGKINCVKGGHNLSNHFLRELLEKNRDKFELVEFEENKETAVYSKNYPTQIAVNG